jgi:hypothetical protein
MKYWGGYTFNTESKAMEALHDIEQEGYTDGNKLRKNDRVPKRFWVHRIHEECIVLR